MKYLHMELINMEELLTPSYHGELCRHNGNNPNYEIACDECDFYLICFPDWKEMLETHATNNRSIDSIKASPDETLEAVLSTKAIKDDFTDASFGLVQTLKWFPMVNESLIFSKWVIIILWMSIFNILRKVQWLEPR